MEDFGQLMRRLLEIQNGGRQSNPELIAEDERLMEGLQKRNVVAMPAQTVKLKPSFGAGAIRGLAVFTARGSVWSFDLEILDVKQTWKPQLV